LQLNINELLKTNKGVKKLNLLVTINEALLKKSVSKLESDCFMPRDDIKRIDYFDTLVCKIRPFVQPGRPPVKLNIPFYLRPNP
jgi:hypothetical protein